MALPGTLRIGNIVFVSNIFLAPMAGVTDAPFRILCREQGAGFAYTEMISAKGVSYGSENSIALARTAPEEGLTGVQIFGSEPDIMAEAARKFEAGGAPLIDVNMGCPMRKITGNGEGSALMRDPALINRIVRTIVAAVNVPVTVKLRRGFDTGNETCVECALAAEDGGAAAVAVHGRFRDEYYSGRSDWSSVRRVKEAAGIPVILSGDVDCAEAARRAFDESGADGIMIGRAAMGDPWIFSRIGGKTTPEGKPETGEMKRVILRHLMLLKQYKGEITAASEFRKHVIWYLKGMRGAAAVRDRICKTKNTDEILEIIENYFEG